MSLCIFQLFWSEFQSLGVIVTNNSYHCENAGEHLKKLNAPTEITSTGYKCNTLVCTGRRHPGLSYFVDCLLCLTKSLLSLSFLLNIWFWTQIQCVVKAKNILQTSMYVLPQMTKTSQDNNGIIISII